VDAGSLGPASRARRGPAHGQAPRPGARAPPAICCHSFQATGITIHQEAGGDIVEAQRLAGHADPRTTQLYSRKTSKLQRAEVERVQL
jgi:integrase